jgi:hypothetical protein
MRACNVKDEMTAAQCDGTADYSVAAIGGTVYALVVTLTNEKLPVGCEWKRHQKRRLEVKLPVPVPTASASCEVMMHVSFSFRRHAVHAEWKRKKRKEEMHERTDKDVDMVVLTSL